MPKIKNLAALAAAVQYGRSYARKNPDKAGQYVDQAAAFVDKQTKGKYSGQIDGVISKVKSAAGLPSAPRHAGNGSLQGFEANAGYGRHEGYGRTTPTTPPSPTATTGPASGTEPGRPFPGSTEV
jgi:antitoxin protein of toxin-antitoxin system